MLAAVLAATNVQRANGRGRRGHELLRDRGPKGTVRSSMTDPLITLRRATFVEAISFVLLLAAMWVKYGEQLPIGALLVRITGMVHGVLFVWLSWCLLQAWTVRQWPIARLAWIFVASLVPIVPFFLDRRFPAWIASSPRWRGEDDARA